MSNDEYLNQIKRLVGNNKLEAAIKELGSLLKDSPQLNEAIIQSARYNDVMEQIRIGTISLEEAELTKNRIRKGVLDLVDYINSQAEKDPYLNSEILGFLAKRTGIHIENNKGVFIGNKIELGGDLNIN